MNQNFLNKNLRDYYRSETYETSIGHRKTYETNRYCHYYYHGAYPLRGNAPGTSNLSCFSLVGDKL